MVTDLPSAAETFITVVSGLPRSGTSLMMQMLAAGGMPALTDQLRQPDENNPRGYLELERVKQLKTNQGWLADARGHAVKIIHLLLRELPVDGRFQYRVLIMQRPIEEVLASQRAMLEREGKPSADAAVLAKVFSTQLSQVEQWLATQSCFKARTVEYHRALEQPDDVARGIGEFLELDLDYAAMVRAVDPALYRQRRLFTATRRAE